MDNKAKKEIVRFYFSFNDPYSFIIAPAVKSLAQNYKVDIEYFHCQPMIRPDCFLPIRPKADITKQI